MSSEAVVQFDPLAFGVRMALRRRLDHGAQIVRWQPLITEVIPEGVYAEDSTPDGDVWLLRLPDEDARAIYEALADYFGHSGNDTRALRRDYDAERSRVDKFIAHITAGASR